MEDYIQQVTKRENIWTETIAAGSVEFVEGIKARLGVKAKHRKVSSKAVGAAYALQDPTVPYNINFGGEIDILRAENLFLWIYLLIFDRLG
ncbi:MAG: hypothetical protein K9J79_09020 [Desulfobacteraceae bacterium]|nr:hypothetical protein [Desulfobacteraceae bacterium]